MKQHFVAIILLVNIFSAAYAAEAQLRTSVVDSVGYPIEKVEEFVKQEAAKIAAAEWRSSYLFMRAATLFAASYFAWPHVSRFYNDSVAPRVPQHILTSVRATADFAKTAAIGVAASVPGNVVPLALGVAQLRAQSGPKCAEGVSALLDYIYDHTDLLGNDTRTFDRALAFKFEYCSQYVKSLTMSEVVDQADKVMAVLLENALRVAAFIQYYRDKNSMDNFQKKAALGVVLNSFVAFIKDLKDIQPEAKTCLVQLAEDGKTPLVQRLQDHQMQLVRKLFEVI